MFSKILIANRGEIAVRIIRACKEMGIATVAVYSEADRYALHVNLADESYCIGPASLKASYLNMPAIVEVAVATGAQAVHPGYGLLSENADFARLLEQCGIKFIGPSGDVIEKMGLKAQARRTMKEAGVPVVPGIENVTSVTEAKRFADEAGYPVIVKASAGGGGKGIRIVRSENELESAVTLAAAEAQSSFGNGALYIEKYMTDVKHVEMQILADEQGGVIVLGERDCSMQRRHQKILEESPCLLLPEKVRQEMIAATVKAAKAANYVNAGTVEYLVDKDFNFYFMEMNTRLQVEHPVTEAVTGVDMVKWQIRIAAGQPLPYGQEGVRQEGCAIECRINSENFRDGFKPSSGKITLLHIPGGPLVRFDTAIYQDYTVPPHYDSMIGKLIVHAPERSEAIRKMQAALCELVIDGVYCNSELHTIILSSPSFLSGRYCTDTLETTLVGKKGGNDKA